MYTKICAFLGACLPGSGVCATINPALERSLTRERRRISRSPDWLSVETASGIRWPTTFGTVCSGFWFGPEDTLTVTCEAVLALAPPAGVWATTVPRG